MEEGEFSKLVPVEQFGYRTIVVDRPLRARWEIGDETWADVEHEKALTKLEPTVRDAVVGGLAALPAERSPERTTAEIRSGPRSSPPAWRNHARR
jgi:type I restriction enzyme M protein